MSRHIITNAPGSPETRQTVVGWDPAQDTFYGHASDPPYDAGTEVFAVGWSPCEIPSIGDLAKALKRYGVELPVEVATKLGEDHLREGSRFAGRPASGLLASMAKTYAGPDQRDRITAALTGRDQAGERQ